MESAGAKRANASLLSAVPIGDLRTIICGYYSVTGEVLLRWTALSAAEEKLVSQNNLESKTVSHTIRVDPRSSPVNLDLGSLRPEQHVGNDVVDVCLRLMEEQVRNYAAEYKDCRVGPQPRIGVMCCAFVISQEIARKISVPETYWLGWCAARNSVHNVFCLDLIMCPLHCSPDGYPLYALGVINCRKHCIDVYQMFGRSAPERVYNYTLHVFERVASFMREQAVVYSPHTENDEAWAVKLHLPDVLMWQAISDKNEGGVCLFMYAYRLALGLDPNFAPEDLPGCRLIMARDLLRLAELDTLLLPFPSQ